MNNVQTYFSSLIQDCIQAEHLLSNNNDIVVISHVCRRLILHSDFLNYLKNVVTEDTAKFVLNAMETIVIEQLLNRLRPLHESLQYPEYLQDTAYSTDLVYNRNRRLTYNVNAEQINLLRSTGCSLQNISGILNISRRTLYRRMKEFNIKRFTSITNAELDSLISVIINEMPNSGEIYIQGCLRSRQIVIPRWKLRECVSRLDPTGRMLRRRNVIKRRKYSVKGPNHLW